MWFNPMMTMLLRSPLHFLLGDGTMLIQFAGRKTGKSFAVPVNVVRDDTDLLVVSFRKRTWWRNLRGGARVTVRIVGRDQSAMANVIEDDASVAENLFAYLQRVPQVAKYLNVKLDPDGSPNRADVAHAAQDRVMIRLQPQG